MGIDFTESKGIESKDIWKTNLFKNTDGEIGCIELEKIRQLSNLSILRDEQKHFKIFERKQINVHISLSKALQKEQWVKICRLVERSINQLWGNDLNELIAQEAKIVFKQTEKGFELFAMNPCTQDVLKCEVIDSSTISDVYSYSPAGVAHKYIKPDLEQLFEEIKTNDKKTKNTVTNTVTVEACITK